MGYTVESLISENPNYHFEHRVLASDVEKANNMIRVIESTRDAARPQVGDIVQYTTKHGQYHPRAHIERLNEDGKLSVCEHPMIPFMYVEKGIVYTSTSGGAWAAIPADLERVGTAQKAFKDWGHCGPCGGGAFTVHAEVNVWRYTDGNPEFTTENYSMFYATRLAEPDGHGYLWHIMRGYSTPHTAFHTDAEYQRWLESIGGVERPAAWGDSRIVWAKKA